MITDKKILDVTCGARSIWFNKRHPDALYLDRRRVEFEQGFDGQVQKIVVDPDVVADFTDLPFDDETFSLVVFDPPHRFGLKNSWIRKKYETYDDAGEMMYNIVRGFRECMRVLKPDGVLVFKWAEIQISTAELIKAVGYTPLFGHRSGKKMGTHWLCFMKGATGNDA